MQKNSKRIGMGELPGPCIGISLHFTAVRAFRIALLTSAMLPAVVGGEYHFSSRLGGVFADVSVRRCFLSMEAL
jgi:hypothetical protein